MTASQYTAGDMESALVLSKNLSRNIIAYIDWVNYS